MRKKGELCDIEIVIGDRKISAHRVILAAVAPDFYQFVSSENYQETLTEIYADAVESLVNFCYTGVIEVQSEQIANFLVCADLFKLINIKEACIGFITLNLNAKNVIKFKQVANCIKNKSLICAADKFICNNFDEVVSSPNFLKI